MADLTKLKPIVRQKCEQLCELVEKELGFKILITSTYRSFEEQHKLFTQVPQVTKADAGYSYHNYGLAFDFVPLINGKPDWGNLDNFKKVGEIGKKLGLEWGGDWKNFVDMPHFQYVLEYKGKPASVFFTDYNDGKIDWSKWDIEPVEEANPAEPVEEECKKNPLDGKKTYIGIAILAIGSMVQMAGLTDKISSSEIETIVNISVTLIGMIIAIIGRIKAQK